MLPGFLAAGALARQNGLAGGIFDAVDKNFDRRADCNLLGLLLVAKLAQCDAAFGLEADIDDRIILFDRQNRTFDDSALEFLFFAHRFIEKGAEIFTCWELNLVIRHGKPGLSWPTGCLRRSSRNPS